MKSNWTQILVFTMLALVLGFVAGRITSSSCDDECKIEKRIIEKHMDDGEDMALHSDEDVEMVFIKEGGDDISLIVDALEDAGFEGDTVVDGASINITRDGEDVQIEVKKEMKGDGAQKKIRIEKEIEKEP